MAAASDNRAPRRPASDTPKLEITLFNKTDGVLSKQIRPNGDDGFVSDGSACWMANGEARRQLLAGLGGFAALIDKLKPDQAIALGTLREDCPERVKIVTKAKLNGAHGVHTIARTSNNVVYRKGRPALLLFDYDTKTMPAETKAEVQRRGGFWPALATVIGGLAGVGRVMRRSTSAGLYRSDTGARLPGSDGEHVYVVVANGDDNERCLRVIHDRAWLAGFGWYMIDRGGRLLERSIVDYTVGASERLVFEGGPILKPPLRQEPRRPLLVEGEVFDTLQACPPLTVVEKSRLAELKAKAAQVLVPERMKARADYIEQKAGELAVRTGVPVEVAKRTIALQCEGVLLSDIVLPFDDDELAGCSVGDVLADPKRFDGATLADPLEGIDYGRCKAMVMLRSDGTPWIHSFAHGGAAYELKLDARALQAELSKAGDGQVAKLFVRLVPGADLDATEMEALRNDVAERSGIGRAALKAAVKQAQAKREQQRAKDQQDRQQAQRDDPRPQIVAPLDDAPYLPVMVTILEVVERKPEPERIRRDIDGTGARARRYAVPGTHAFSEANSEAGVTKLPTPEQWSIVRMSEIEMAEELERHIDFVEINDKGNVRSVHLAMDFVRHFRKRDDSLPTVVAIATMPIVLADGGVLAKEWGGFDGTRGIDFRIPKEVLALLPRRQDCDDDAVLEAIQFLTDEWLCDVATDFAGKCVIIAVALTIIERSLLPERPVFFVTAGRRGSGKTTTLIMLIMAVTGLWPAAAAWSTVEEERRKALMSYFLAGVPYILWDNIARGSDIRCPHIERSCTANYYSDRRLGVSEMVATAGSTIHLFTGNNIGPAGGDLGSRSLGVRLEVERTDPENRAFKHPDPIGWTGHRRAEILQALYTVLLGNPALDLPRDAEMKTRFKIWQRLVGSAIEHAAQLAFEDVDFAELFMTMDEEGDEEASLADVLDIMHELWQDEETFTAQELCDALNNKREDLGSEARDQLRGFFCPRLKRHETATAKSIGWRLKRHIAEPVRKGKLTLFLKALKGGDGGKSGKLYKIVAKAGSAADSRAPDPQTPRRGDQMQRDDVGDDNDVIYDRKVIRMPNLRHVKEQPPD